MLKRIAGRRLMAVAGSLILAQGLVPSALTAQGEGLRPLITRAELQSLADEAARRGDPIAAELRTRLAEGDIKAGDRVAVQVVGEQALTDTFAVRSDRTLQFPDMAPLPVSGLLRSEIEAKVAEHIRRYIKEPQVRAEALLRIGVIGAVTRPGFYNVPAGTAVSDLFMSAGGLTPMASLEKLSTRRNGSERWNNKRMRQALASGASLDQSGFLSGDEVVVGERRPSGSTLTTIAAVSGVLLAVVGVASVF